MSWYAKPSGAYNINSDEAKENIVEIYNLLKSEWTLESICGMLGNVYHESGLNPWRWQSDEVSLTDDKKGYGLVQFTPAYGYINNYGVGVTGFSPNLSVKEVTSGATPQDGQAQIIVINEDRAGKFLNRASYCSYLDISNCFPFSSYKQVTDLYVATVGWLFNYEFPADYSESVAGIRYATSLIIYDYLSDTPVPPIPTAKNHMPIWMMCRKRI